MGLVRNRLALVAVLLCLELLALGLAYQVLTSMECRATDAFGVCRVLRTLTARAMSVIAVFGLFVWARREALRGLMRRIEAGGDGRAGLVLHGFGVVLMFLPLAMARGHGGDLGAVFEAALVPWLAGAVAATLGALLWLAPAASWRAWLREEKHRPLLLLGLGLLLPDLADLAYPLWNWPQIADATFRCVCLLLQAFGAAPDLLPESYVIGLDGFYVQVAQQCSGVEGFALVTGFALIYGFLFRRQLRFPHFWLVVIPLGILLSWLLNIVRIAVLIAIGAHLSPELAVNGFHSYAGWMFFTLLAMGMLYGVQATPWLQAAGGRPAPRYQLREDRTAALIVPFIAFMLASTAAAALSPQPDLAYPVKALAMAMALAWFAPVYRRFAWTLDPVAVGSGAVVGIAWLVTRQAPSAADAGLAAGLAGIGALALALWAALRLAGTVLLVPFVEELFFRGYLLGRLSRGGRGAQLVAIIVSSGLFALLHDRWLIAGAAGVAFALVLLRRGRLTDAAVAHAVANLIVALWAVTQGDWGAI